MAVAVFWGCVCVCVGEWYVILYTNTSPALLLLLLLLLLHVLLLHVLLLVDNL